MWKKLPSSKEKRFNTNFKPGDYLQFSIQRRVGGAKNRDVKWSITFLFRWTQKQTHHFPNNPSSTCPISMPSPWNQAVLLSQTTGIYPKMSGSCIIIVIFAFISWNSARTEPEQSQFLTFYCCKRILSPIRLQEVSRLEPSGVLWASRWHT